MKTSSKIIILVATLIAVFCLSVIVGSVNISIEEIVAILGYKIFQIPLSENIQRTTVSILWYIRIPRSVVAFIVGAGLAVSGAVMQSMLRNPLASTYTLGVSSGAALGAAVVIVSGITLPFLGIFTLPFIGFLGGLSTILLVISFTMRLDKNMSNQTIILMGMVFSLFVNALLTFITAFSRQHLEQLVFWQMGSLSGRNWTEILVIFFITIIGTFLLIKHARDLDVMTFGEEKAASIGVDLKKVKFRLITLSALITGVAVSFVGIIGFVDLIIPHLTRKLFGSSHQIILPISALMGGGFLVAADLISRTVLAPSEIPIGAVTALLGAPFFAYIYFYKRKV